MKAAATTQVHTTGAPLYFNQCTYMLELQLRCNSQKTHSKYYSYKEEPHSFTITLVLCSYTLAIPQQANANKI